MMSMLALTVVLLAGLYLLALAAAVLLAPERAERFLLGFAGTARRHYAELALRALTGWAFVLHASRMRFGDAFRVAGWALLLTTAGLALVPWRWHGAFARRAVPLFTRYLWLVGVVSLALGACVIVGALA